MEKYYEIFLFSSEEGNSAFFGDGFFIEEATLEDAPVIWQTIDAHRDYLRTWLPFIDSLKEVADEEAFLTSQLTVPYEDRNLVFVIRHGYELCGLAGFVITDNLNHRTEIGYWLLPEYQGQGVMTRCVRHLCEWAVRERGMNSIRIRCAVGNLPSNAIPRRLGFTLEGTERDGELLVTGEYTDLNVYSILKREVEAWPKGVICFPDPENIAGTGIEPFRIRKIPSHI